MPPIGANRAVFGRTPGSGRVPRRPGRSAPRRRSAGRRRPPRRPRAALATTASLCFGIAQQRLDPGLGPVVLGHVVVDEQLTEQDRRRGCRRTCGRRGSGARADDERVDLGVLGLQVRRRSSRSARRRAGSRSASSVIRAVSTIVGRSARPRAARRALLDMCFPISVVSATLAAWTRSPRSPPIPRGQRSSSTSTACSPRSSSGRRMRASRTRRDRNSTARGHLWPRRLRDGPHRRARARIVGVDGLRYVGQHGLELEPAAAGFAERIHVFARGPAGPTWS